MNLSTWVLLYSTRKTKKINFMKFADLDKIKSGSRKGEVSATALARNLKKLRNEICLNSLFLADYENSLGIDYRICSSFFDGYMSFLEEKEYEKYGNNDLTLEELCREFDTTANLIEWYYCHETFGDEDL